MRLCILLLCLFLASCASAPALTPTPGPTAARTPGATITREQALAAALKIASTSAPEISGALVPPSNIQVEQISLGEAMQRMFGNATPPRGYSAAAPVWFVTMDGLWGNEVQAPGVTATQPPYHHYLIVLDAMTGVQIEGSLRP